MTLDPTVAMAIDTPHQVATFTAAAIGTLFTLFVVPSIYMVVARTRRVAAVAAEAVTRSVRNLAEAPS